MPWAAATRPRPDRRLSSVFLAPHLVPTKMVRDLRHRRAAEDERERGNKSMPMAGSTAPVPSSYHSLKQLSFSNAVFRLVLIAARWNPEILLDS
jgi:hypothetical protein